MLPNIRLFSLLLSILFLFHSCFTGVKKNIDNLKNCKFELVNLLVHSEPNKDFLLIPKFVVTPVISASNPNEEDVEIYKFNLKLFLVTNSGQQLIGTIINEEPKLIPKNSQVELQLTLDIDQKKGIDSKLISLLLQLVSAAAKGSEAEIYINGDVEIRSSIGSISLPISETQKIKLKR
ncbi:hypothetical protein EHQ58_16885 [Leptospira ognonensis]|uniref:Late embryogenesis abundant protein LEA-2 subgroup domain-containing protein n=1 Tax=Leptospira ognonensis TaxID=2484945 RepID=A0A4V3JQM0_9LEPT|nr:hypothetical protein EHQ58_16885 [Leptospira ognonensis]